MNRSSTKPRISGGFFLHKWVCLKSWVASIPVDSHDFPYQTTCLFFVVIIGYTVYPISGHRRFQSRSLMELVVAVSGRLSLDQIKSRRETSRFKLGSSHEKGKEDSREVKREVKRVEKSEE